MTQIRRGGSGEVTGDTAGLAAERDRLSRTLRDTRLQLAMTQARLEALEGSATMELGRALVGAARRPGRRAMLLPLDLYRLWRERGGLAGARNAPPALTLASAQLSDLAGVGERFLAARTAPGQAGRDSGAEQLVITGALTARTCATLAPDAVVHPLLPHDAEVMLEATGADMVVIEAAAMLGGSPWAYAGDPAGADRGRRLARLIVTAHSLGKPVVFVRNVPAHLATGLDWVATSCDFVSDEGFGVQLALFNPIGLADSRPVDPVYAGARDPRESPAARTALDELTSGGDAPVGLIGETPWRRLPSLYREHAVFVAASADQAREQLACGARVTGPLDDEPVAGGFASGADGPDSPGTSRERSADERTAATELSEQIAVACAAGPRGLAEIRVALRDIFETYATAARLAGLARLVGLPGDVVSGRQIAVLAQVPDADAAHELAACLLRQRLRPAEVVVSVTGDPRTAELACRAVTAALAELTDYGVTVRVVPGGGPDARRGVTSWLPDCARDARSPWVAPWATGREYPDTYLLDLACARECSRADAVGYSTGAGTGASADIDLPAGIGALDYAFTDAVEPVLARRELLGPAAPLVADWGKRGLRLFAVSPADAAVPATYTGFRT
jgi:hypothetical protein